MKFKGLTLDKFQEDAINAIEDNKSVMVSAPTGSGKTLIADYIIDRDLKKKKRVVYTAPIKALSNQKFADFSRDLGAENIGLLTGDTVINPTAPILIMTTEIYRNMVVVGDNIIDTISYVIFDEIHFISDVDRGHIWEESIIFSPEHIRFLCLSATVPNAEEFASWIQSIKKHDIITVHHVKRPVPLEKLFYDTDLGITTIKKVNERKDLDTIPEYRGAYKKPRRQRVKTADHRNLIRDLGRKNLPCIFFTFSRADTQERSKELAQQQSFLTSEESQEVLRAIREHLGKTDKGIQRLPSTQLLRQVLPKGIGFHHAGLLPVLKHIVEDLFGRKLLRVLYATETFAVGINMPAKTVCFKSLRKFDGREFRYLNSKEYFQLAGRAGRRGIDTTGLSVAIVNRQLDDMKRIAKFTKADVDPIRSQFKISYNTVLNLIGSYTHKEITKILASNFYVYQRGRTDTITRRFENMKKTLERMKYIEKHTLTSKGQFIRNIFTDELVTGEIFGTTFFQDLNEYQILLLVATLAYEPRSGMQFSSPIMTKEVKHVIKKVRDDTYLKRIKKLKNISVLTAIINPMFNGTQFIKLLDTSSFLEGDLMRFLRQMVDRLNQIRKATNEYALDQLVSNCIGIIDKCMEGIDVI